MSALETINAASQAIRVPTVASMLEPVVSPYGLSVHEIRAPFDEPGSRRPYVCFVRTKAVRALHERGWSFMRIGRYFGGRDHATIRYMIKNGAGRDLTDYEINLLRKLLRGEVIKPASEPSFLKRLDAIKWTGNTHYVLTERGRRIAIARCAP